MHNMITIHAHFEMDTVYFVCLGASADIKDDFGRTPLQVAGNAKVNMKTCTYHHKV